MPWQTLRGGQMNDREFGRWASLLEDRTGVVVPPERKQFIASNVSARMRENGVQSFDDYYALITGRSGQVEWALLVDRLTVHETRFFRHSPSFRVARETVAATAGRGEFHAWSVGCSTGEEAWSLAMVLDAELKLHNDNRYLSVTGTDISTPALDLARHGQYDRSRLSEIPEHLASRYTETRGDRFIMDPGLRRRVAFARLNLMDSQATPAGAMDLIFCQNVLIYFPRDRRGELLGRLVDKMRAGGRLVLGAGEAVGFRDARLQRIDDRRTLSFRRLPE